jgi:hypothetical protein
MKKQERKHNKYHENGKTMYQTEHPNIDNNNEKQENNIIK